MKPQGVKRTPRPSRSPFAKIVPEMAKMPELSHWPDRPQPYTPERSEVLNWLANLSGCDIIGAQKVFDAARNKGLIAYDHTTKLWRGVKGDLKRNRRETSSSPYAHLWPELRLMPKLSHWPDRPEPYSPERSQVLAYISEGYGANLRESDRIFQAAKHAGVVLFDKATKLWRGAKGGKP